MASITDLFDRVSDSNTGRPIIADLASPGKAIGASSLNLAAATNWTTDSAIHFSIYETTTVGTVTIKNASTQTDWKGTLSGTTIGNLTITGGTDRAYTAGAKVELTSTSRYAKDLYDGIAVGHNQNGTHKAFTESNIVPTAAIQDSAVTAAKIADATLTNAKLSTTAGELGGAWTTWTPTWGSLSIGNGTSTTKYTRVGKTVYIYVRVTFGSTSSMFNSPNFTLPVTASATTDLHSRTGIGDTGVAEYIGSTVLLDTTKAVIRVVNSSGTYASVSSIDTNVPMTWGSGDGLTVIGSYEAA